MLEILFPYFEHVLLQPHTLLPRYCGLYVVSEKGREVILSVEANAFSSLSPPPLPSLPYKVDTSRPSLRTNRTRRVPGDPGKEGEEEAPGPREAHLVGAREADEVDVQPREQVREYLPTSPPR